MVSTAGLCAAAALLAIIVVSTCSDVVLRYFANRPTEWVSDSVGFFLCAAIFLAIPELARRQGHVAITILSEYLSVGANRVLNAGIAIAASAACLVAAWITGMETLRQFANGIYTVGTFTVPKWWISAFIVAGFALTGLQFLRQAFAGPAAPVPTSGDIR